MEVCVISVLSQFGKNKKFVTYAEVKLSKYKDWGNVPQRKNILKLFHKRIKSKRIRVYNKSKKKKIRNYETDNNSYFVKI